jgi:hypothetical protein
MIVNIVFIDLAPFLQGALLFGDYKNIGSK